MQKRSLVLRGWAFLQAVKIKKHRQIYYDSLLGDGHICLSLIKKYLEQESMQKGHQEKGPLNWLDYPSAKPSREVCPEFKQHHVKDIGRIIAKEILDGVMFKPKEIDESIVR
uniref:Uncharacterized protein n=1 Tax=Ditylenchus dipsaci TaxID=166011 RepID=A0A915DSK1_9BILA